MVPNTVLYLGRDEALAKPLGLRAGPLTMLFEPETGFLRQIRLGDHEVVRAIYGAVRDRYWGTVQPGISNLRSEIKSDSFRLSFDVVCQQNEVDFCWHGEVTGESNGQITYAFDGQARSRFLKNRIGLCVLHPMLECSGRACVVKHLDGSEDRGTFPDLISPHQPFFEIAAISYEVADTGITAEVQFTGEVFEMEDQRNWTDASFKTYSTPQSLPKPAQMETGAKVQHTVTIKLKGKVRTVRPVLQDREPQISISAADRVLPLPPIGYCVASHGQPLSGREIQRLKRLRPSHLRVDLRLASADFPAVLEQTANQASVLDTGLHVALIFSNRAEQELRSLGAELKRIRPRVLLWLVFHEAEQVTQEKWVRLAQSVLVEYAPDAGIAAGTREFFTELNRSRPPAGASFFPCYSFNPQVHMLDNRTMVENLAGQVSTVETAKGFAHRPVVISPITLRIRGLAPAAKAPCVKMVDLPADVDPRQMSLFGAGWTLGSITRLAGTGNIHGLTYFETTGWKGLMETEAGSPCPEKFPSLPGSVFPVYHVLADIAEFASQQIYPTHSSHPLLAEALALVQPNGHRRILAANLTDEPQRITVETGTNNARVRYLDERNAEEAMRNPEAFREQTGAETKSVEGKMGLNLLPFALARIDID